MENLKFILIKSNVYYKTEQNVLNALYEILIKNFNYEWNNNAELESIIGYLDYYTDNSESFCYSKKSGKIGMNTSYLIDNLENTSKYSSIVILDRKIGDILGVLVFKYSDMSSESHDYDNSLYIDSFCTNQQHPVAGIGKMLITTIINATEELTYIKNIFLNAATRDSEGFYERFDFEHTGRSKYKMKEFKYPVDSVIQAEQAEAEQAEYEALQAKYKALKAEYKALQEDEEYKALQEEEEYKALQEEERQSKYRKFDSDEESESNDEEEIPRSLPLFLHKPVEIQKPVQIQKPVEIQKPVQIQKPVEKKNYIKIWTRGSNLRETKSRLDQLKKIYGSDFNFIPVKRGTIKNHTKKNIIKNKPIKNKTIKNKPMKKSTKKSTKKKI
jgi:hypothetical protein